MEIADLIAINKYDGDYEPYCKRLKVFNIYIFVILDGTFSCHSFYGT